MKDQKKQGFFKQLFGGSHKSCCSVEFEEVNDKNSDTTSDVNVEITKPKVIAKTTLPKSPSIPQNTGYGPSGCSGCCG